MRAAIFAVALALAAGACSTEPAAPAGPPPPDFTAIREAREAYAGPAQALGTAVRAAVAAGELARLEPEPSSADGTPAVAARSFALDQYDARLDEVLDAVAEAARPDAADDAATPDPSVAAADAAWAGALREATQLAAGGRLEVELLRTLLDAEATLVGIATLWDEPGSRREQTERLSDAAMQAEELVAELADRQELPPCSQAVERRRAAGALVAERTRELLGYVERGQGRAYDEARAAYDEAPWHDGLPGDDAGEASCWRTRSAVATGASAVEDAIADLVEALNPATDLPDPTTEEG